MKTLIVQVDVNGGEYCSYTRIKCKSWLQLDKRVLVVDLVIITFDEDILDIEEL
ncbi:hypothetical protein KEM09_12065 [Carboxylicivirga mesophila]|uniref:Uncharacterized protein n=1 Tax=Carboxylicivirga mesophila TaxID=1166478 RepID=A0ABS5KAU8_9BACT|nr:hypothetical protein [Carboxylicivirga mesophila]MBS2212145.1 hypothetical protein [Carboxylicivirga mesophila]